MAYRNGTYIAFDGMNTTNPTESDIKYYNLIKGWHTRDSFPSRFSDSHGKTSQVRDTSLTETLKSRLRERLSQSKNLVVILTEDTGHNREMLNYEIEQAVDKYNLPIIIAYPSYSSILNPNSHVNKWPKALRERIENGTAKCIHIPFKKDTVINTISRFSIHNEMPNGSLIYYKRGY